MQLAQLNEKIPLGLKGSKYSTFIDQIYESLKKHYLKQQRDWYINERFVRWDHWIVFNKTTNTVQTIPITDWEVRRTVNKIRTQVRGVKNFIKRNQPRWQTAPTGGSDEELKDALNYNKILQDVYETRKIPWLLTDVIVNSLKTSVWIIEWWLVKHNGHTYLDFWTDDTFDIFFDPYATTPQNGRFVLKAVKKSISSLKNNKKYTIDWVLTPDWREWASDYKDILEKEKFNQNQGLEDMQSIIVKELWYKFVDEKWNDVIKKITSAGNQIIHEETTRYKRFPFFVFNPEKASNSIYSDPWIKDLISPNKSLDKVASQIESYIQRMLAGKYIVKRWVEVSTVTDRGAEKITYKGNTPPVMQNLAPLPSTPFQYISNLEGWIEEFGGIREASLGRAPGSLQSGKGLEALQAADAATVAEPIENLELFLSEIAEFILETISDSTITTETIFDGKENINYIGSIAGIEPEWAVVVEPRKVKVVIVPELAYTEEAKKELIFKLAEAQIIDPETLMEYLNISNISDIMERVKVRKDEAFKEEMMKQKASHATNWEWPDDSATLADQENIQMAAWQQVPKTPQALWIPEHLELHMQFLSENSKDFTPDAMRLFEEHIRAEEWYNAQSTTAPQNNQPEPQIAPAQEQWMPMEQ